VKSAKPMRAHDEQIRLQGRGALHDQLRGPAFLGQRSRIERRGTGLLDRYLFQGLSGGVRAEVIRRITLYSSIGRNSRSGDAKASWNQLYGIMFADLLHTALRVDARYSQFNSPFGTGGYQSLSVSRQMRDDMRIELTGGLQTLRSTLAPSSNSHFVTSSVDWSPGRHFFSQTFFTWQRGGLANYDQVSIVLGSRF